MATSTPLYRRDGSSYRTAAKGRGAQELTSEMIAEHLEAFRSSGGTIEVLGTTRVLQQVDGVRRDDSKPGK